MILSTWPSTIRPRYEAQQRLRRREGPKKGGVGKDHPKSNRAYLLAINFQWILWYYVSFQAGISPDPTNQLYMFHHFKKTYQTKKHLIGERQEFMKCAPSSTSKCVCLNVRENKTLQQLWQKKLFSFQLKKLLSRDFENCRGFRNLAQTRFARFSCPPVERNHKKPVKNTICSTQSDV